MASNEPFLSIPLAEVFRAANDLVTLKLIEDWALGGALAALTAAVAAFCRSAGAACAGDADGGSAGGADSFLPQPISHRIAKRPRTR